jgi:hypothetical protein
MNYDVTKMNFVYDIILAFCNGFVNKIRKKSFYALCLYYHTGCRIAQFTSGNYNKDKTRPVVSLLYIIGKKRGHSGREKARGGSHDQETV